MSATDVVCVLHEKSIARVSPFSVRFSGNHKEGTKVIIKIDGKDTKIEMSINSDSAPIFTQKDRWLDVPYVTHEKKWRQRTVEYFSTVPGFADSTYVGTPEGDILAKFLSDNNIKDDETKISFQCDDEIIHASFFLWKDTDRICVVDIDGTVTRSDVWGQICTYMGKDYTHPGAAKLFTHMVKNGYKLVYLTARAITQIGVTRDYMRQIDQDGIKMPRMPVITTPNTPSIALLREVIVRSPETFKIEILSYISMLFSKSPFYAGFGNRETDHLAYSSSGMTERVYIIDKKSQIRHDKLSYNTYLEMEEKCDVLFPPWEFL